LAALVGTSQPVIARLEDADYRGHSLSILQRIARALKKRLDVRFVEAGSGRRVRAA
jgi:predicted transcriptional regulator